VTTAARTVEHVTCLGCGCACDDITVVVQRGRLTEAQRACALGAAWFGDGQVPDAVRIRGRAGTLERALGAATTLLRDAQRPLVYLAGDISCEVQRDAVAIADRLKGAFDSLAGTAAPGVLGAQRRGRAGATLGELRQRADLVVFWGVDPGARYPRFSARYAVDPVGLAAPAGRKSRRVIAVDVGQARGPADADDRVAIPQNLEVDALGAMRAALQGRAVGANGPLEPAIALVQEMTTARYVALVADAEPGPTPSDPDRAEALIALAQVLNGPTRCALSMLRGGGNRAGADAVLTWQTGFPFAVDFGRGYPTYRPHVDAAARLAGGEVDAALVIGTPATLPESVARGLGGVATVAIGPRASAAGWKPVVAVDTGMAGIHEGGTAFRMDDVPLPLRPALDDQTVRSAAATVRALRERLEAGA
jgi:formylmethanofuran dehydrogenase subunit B